MSFDQATAASRTAPLKAGRSNVTVALPSASSFTTPEKSASGGCVGRLPSRLPLAVAADMDRAGRALHAVDQHAPEVADLDRQLALAEEIGARVRRLEAGEVEDADVDRRDGDARLLARREAGDLDRHGHRLARLARAPARRARRRACARPRAMANQATPIARPGMRLAATSSGRWVSATA